MTDSSESGKGPSVERLLSDLSAAQDRAHRTSERASQQFTKLLGTVHGGLGVAIAAWLQRIFEQSGHGLLSPLAWYLAIALFFIALGLVTLALAAILDQRSANHFAQSTTHNTTRVWLFSQRTQIKKLDPGDEKSAKELSCTEEDADLIRKIAQEDASAKRINAISERIGYGSWVCLIAAFVTLAIGIVNTINHFRC